MSEHGHESADKSAHKAESGKTYEKKGLFNRIAGFPGKIIKTVGTAIGKVMGTTGKVSGKVVEGSINVAGIIVEKPTVAAGQLIEEIGGAGGSVVDWGIKKVRNLFSHIPGLGWIKADKSDDGHGDHGGHSSHSPSKGEAHNKDTHEKHESAEKVDKVELQVAGKCNSDGKYVGLSDAERKKRGIELKDQVEVLDDHGKSLGTFTVGKIKSEVLLKAEHGDKEKVCTANVPEGVKKIVIKKLAHGEHKGGAEHKAGHGDAHKADEHHEKKADAHKTEAHHAEAHPHTANATHAANDNAHGGHQTETKKDDHGHAAPVEHHAKAA